MKISFIIPAYNAAMYITRCINSIYKLELPQEEFEIVVVDDCSTDSTIEVLEKIKNQTIDRESNLVIIRQKNNQRQGAARNKGLEVAKGQFIMFVDSDDEVSCGIVTALDMAMSAHLEMVAIRVNQVDQNGEETNYKSLPYLKDTVFTGIELQSAYPYWETAPWGYLYCRKFVNRVNYPFAVGVIFEDSDYVNTHLYAAQRMGYCDIVGYKFTYNAMSITHTMSYFHLADYFLLGTRMLELYERIADKTTVYANSIIEGGSYNIWTSFCKLFKLNSVRDIYLFYKRIDKMADRKKYLHQTQPKYCWTWWTKLGLKHQWIMLIIASCMIYSRKFGHLFKHIN